MDQTLVSILSTKKESKRSVCVCKNPKPPLPSLAGQTLVTDYSPVLADRSLEAEEPILESKKVVMYREQSKHETDKES